MAAKTGKGGVVKGGATVAHVMEMLASIEAQCRLARLMLQRLDPSTPIPLNREIKALAKTASKQPYLPEIC